MIDPEVRLELEVREILDVCDQSLEATRQITHEVSLRRGRALQTLRDSGWSVQRIADWLGVTKSAVYASLAKAKS